MTDMQYSVTVTLALLRKQPFRDRLKVAWTIIMGTKKEKKCV